MKNILLYLYLTITLLILTACGGGGSDTGLVSQNPPTSEKTIAKLTIIQTGSLPASTAISGTEFTITLPAGVTPALVNGVVTNGVVAVSGAFAESTLAPQVIYTAATAGSLGTLRVILTTSATAGVSLVGEIAKITLQLGNGITPTASSFPISNVSVYDATVYGAISGMGVSLLSVMLQA